MKVWTLYYLAPDGPRGVGYTEIREADGWRITWTDRYVTFTNRETSERRQFPLYGLREIYTRRERT